MAFLVKRENNIYYLWNQRLQHNSLLPSLSLGAGIPGRCGYPTLNILSGSLHLPQAMNRLIFRQKSGLGHSNLRMTISGLRYSFILHDFKRPGYIQLQVAKYFFVSFSPLLLSEKGRSLAEPEAHPLVCRLPSELRSLAGSVLHC